MIDLFVKSKMSNDNRDSRLSKRNFLIKPCRVYQCLLVFIKCFLVFTKCLLSWPELKRWLWEDSWVRMWIIKLLRRSSWGFLRSSASQRLVPTLVIASHHTNIERWHLSQYSDMLSIKRKVTSGLFQKICRNKLLLLSVDVIFALGLLYDIFCISFKFSNKFDVFYLLFFLFCCYAQLDSALFENSKNWVVDYLCNRLSLVPLEILFAITYFLKVSHLLLSQHSIYEEALFDVLIYFFCFSIFYLFLFNISFLSFQ